MTSYDFFPPRSLLKYIEGTMHNAKTQEATKATTRVGERLVSNVCEMW